MRFRARFQPTFDGWRAAARHALADDVHPDHIEWQGDDTAQQGLIALPDLPDSPRTPPAVPRRLVSLLRNGTAFDAPDRWDIAYRVAHRVRHQGAEVLDDVGIDSVRLLRQRDKAVRRDVHKMHAFVRFSHLQDDEGEHWVAWHCPDHHIIRLAAPHFAKRFGDMRFALLTPKGSAVHTPGNGLVWTPAVSTYSPRTADELDSLWCTYYASIFNPARGMTDAMRAEMPMKHWRTLPETRQIPRLLATAPRRMAEAAARTPPGALHTLPPIEQPLDAVHAAVRACRGCPLAEPATQAVPGEGPLHARIALVGEQPGDNEDRMGRPFIGPAGRVLDDAIAAAGLDRDALYLTNTVKHFRHQKRGKVRMHERPDPWHVEQCAPFLFAELARVQPIVTLALGATAARALLGRAGPLHSQYGRIQSGRFGHAVRVAPHPAAILRSNDGTRLMDVLVQALRDAREDCTTAP